MSTRGRKRTFCNAIGVSILRQKAGELTVGQVGWTGYVAVPNENDLDTREFCLQRNSLRQSSRAFLTIQYAAVINPSRRRMEQAA